MAAREYARCKEGAEFERCRNQQTSLVGGLQTRVVVSSRPQVRLGGGQCGVGKSGVGWICADFSDDDEVTSNSGEIAAMCDQGA